MHLIITSCLLIICGIVDARFIDPRSQSVNQLVRRRSRSIGLPYPSGYQYNAIEPSIELLDGLSGSFDYGSLINTYKPTYQHVKISDRDAYSVPKLYSYRSKNPLYDSDYISVQDIPRLTPEDSYDYKYLASPWEKYRTRPSTPESDIDINLVSIKKTTVHGYGSPIYQSSYGDYTSESMPNFDSQLLNTIFKDSQLVETSPDISKVSSPSIIIVELLSEALEQESTTTTKNPIDLMFKELLMERQNAMETSTDDESNSITTEGTTEEKLLSLFPDQVEEESEDESSTVKVEETATEDESSSVKVEETATEDESSSVVVEETTTEDESSSVIIEETATEDESSSVVVEETTTEDESSSVIIEETATEDESSSVIIEETATEDESSSVIVEETATEDESSSVIVEETATEDESSSVIVEETATEDNLNFPKEKINPSVTVNYSYITTEQTPTEDVSNSIATEQTPIEDESNYSTTEENLIEDEQITTQEAIVASEPKDPSYNGLFSSYKELSDFDRKLEILSKLRRFEHSKKSISAEFPSNVANSDEQNIQLQTQSTNDWEYSDYDYIK